MLYSSSFLRLFSSFLRCHPKASYGFGDLHVINATQASWKWFQNDDLLPSIADEVRFVKTARGLTVHDHIHHPEGAGAGRGREASPGDQSSLPTTAGRKLPWLTSPLGSGWRRRRRRGVERRRPRRRRSEGAGRGRFCDRDCVRRPLSPRPLVPSCSPNPAHRSPIH